MDMEKTPRLKPHHSQTYNGWEFNRPTTVPQHVGRMSVTDGVPIVRSAPAPERAERPRRANFGSIQRFQEDAELAPTLPGMPPTPGRRMVLREPPEAGWDLVDETELEGIDESRLI